MINTPAPFHVDPSLDIDALIEQAKAYLSSLEEAEKKVLDAQVDIRALLLFHSTQIDRILSTIWSKVIDDSTISLLAIGGYGRRELFPRSDIDIFILLPQSVAEKISSNIEHFIQHAWSLNLDIAQSVSTYAQCIADAKSDSDLLTSLLEARLIAGNDELYTQIRQQILTIISPLQFIECKRQEQCDRDHKQEQLGRLEPNIKIAPGGLRDVHMIGWINAYVYHTYQYEHLIERQLLTAEEYDQLIESTEVLWRIRFALHLYGRAKKDVLDFNQQKILAALFGYQDNDASLAIEQFMRQFYRHSLRIRRINRLLVKLIETNISPDKHIVAINEAFETRNNRLALRKGYNFSDHPLLIWQLFLTLQNNPTINGIHPTLAREMSQQREHIFSETFRQNPESYRLFVEILNHPGEVYLQLRRMHRYGMLYLFIPAFWQTVGRMQYDLFHQYTVDQHTLRLIGFLDQFKTANTDYPQAHDIMRQLNQPALLYIAALFHDIGKGLGGDHSERGAQILADFCAQANIFNDDEITLMVFLVKHHLSLSLTAQKKDLSDPEVIAEFAAIFPSAEALDCLYLLTMADVSATNATLWNSWRANLFHTLYQLTANALASPLPPTAQLVRTAQDAARPLLTIEQDQLNQLWSSLPEYFFLNESPAIIANKTYQLCQHADEHAVSLIQRHPTRLFVSSTHAADKLFAIITHFLEKRDLDIYEARLYASDDNKLTLQQFSLSDSATPLGDLSEKLKKVIEQGATPQPLKARLAHHHLKFFHPDTIVTYEQEPALNRTIMHLICKDRHGLLSIISRVFLSLNIHLTHAKIATLGEKVEDTFYLTDAEQQAITDNDTLDTLKSTLISVLKPDTN